MSDKKDVPERCLPYIPVLVKSNGIPDTRVLPQSSDPAMPPHNRDDPRVERYVENFIASN